ncbi:MAG: DUF3396 domain-containing protein [Myxococcales bacterium]|nr:DUF3396 domain-containing protein [Myxococcales bacterium]
MTVPTDPSRTVARAELTLTLYLAEPLHWAHEGAASLLQAFLAVVPAEFLTRFATSRTQRWLSVDRSRQQELGELLKLPWSESVPRHLFRLDVVDDPHCPSCGFSYLEIDPARSECAGVVEITLPQEFDAGYLLPIARAALAAGPLYSGVGGYGVRMNQAYLADAFDIAWAWSRRFPGLDIQFPERMAWHAPQGLPGTNWLTFIGAPVAERFRFDLGQAERHPWVDPMITTERVGDNLMVIAGETPTTGDRHHFDSLAAYREVATTTQKLLVKHPPTLPSCLLDEHADQAWFRRLCI